MGVFMKRKDLILMNKKLADKFMELGITHFRLTSLGNSLALGLSLVRGNQLLLYRNLSLSDVMDEASIALERYHFACIRGNSEVDIYSFLVNNVKESSILEMNFKDYMNIFDCFSLYQLDNRENMPPYSSSYFDKGIRDLVLESAEGLANVIVYQGCTNSLTKAFFDKKKMVTTFLFEKRDDFNRLSSILDYFQMMNRINGSTTQIYLCGVPDVLGLHFSEIINASLKSLSKRYANVCYVSPVCSKLFYLDRVSNRIKMDVHYDEEEYLKLNYHIIVSIYENYAFRQKLILLDRELYRLNNLILVCKKRNDFSLNMLYSLSEIFKKYSCFHHFENLEVEKYLMGRFTTDFYCLGRENIRSMIKKK